MFDNAEGYEAGPELRIALVDRELPPDALMGLDFPPIWSLAAAGKVRGMLLSLDPAKPDQGRAVLMVPAQPGQAPANLTGRDIWHQLTVTQDRVVAQVERTDEKPGIDFPWASYKLRFDVPLVREPAITADLKGRAAQQSIQIRTLRQLASAMKAGDMEAVRKASSARSHEARELQRKAAGMSDADYRANTMGMGRQLEKVIEQFQRVVERGPRASAFAKTRDGRIAMSLVLEDGRWKTD